MNTSSAFQMLQTGTTISGGTNILKTPDIGFPQAFSVNETLFFHNKCQNHSCVWDQ